MQRNVAFHKVIHHVGSIAAQKHLANQIKLLLEVADNEADA
jgi:hypothetical protein